VKPIGQHRKSVPPNVAAAVMHALEKLPADRFESAKAFADALADPGFTTVVAGMTARSSDNRRAVSLPVFGAMIAVLAAVGAAGWLRRAGVPEPQVVRFTHPLPSDGALSAIEVSPDGSEVLYQLLPDDATWIRRFDENEARPLPSRGFNPRFSPAGAELVTVERSTPWAYIITPVDGGPVRRPTNGIDAHPDYLWGADGYFYMSGIPGGMVRFREQDQVVDTLTDSDGWPEALLPDGSGLLFIRRIPGGRQPFCWISRAGPKPSCSAPRASRAYSSVRADIWSIRNATAWSTRRTRVIASPSDSAARLWPTHESRNVYPS
jgi:serine/threonine-protein kinase